MSWFEIVAAAIGAASVYLSVRQSLWSWPTAIVNVLLYTVVFFRARLYADMGLQVVYAALSAYGWYQWRFGGAAHSTLPVSRTPRRLWPVLALVAGSTALLLGWGFARWTDAAIPYVDSALTAVSLVAQWMMTRKLLEHWLLWIAVDVVYVPVFVGRHLYPTAALYAIFLGLAVAGYLSWRRDWQGRAPAEPPGAPRAA